MLNYRVDDATGKVYDFRRQRTLMSTFTRPPWWGVQVIGNVAATAHKENNYDARAIARNAAIGVLRTNAYYAVAVGLEQLAIHMLSPHRAVKYLKDVGASAIHKTWRYESRFLAALHIIPTAIYGTCLTHIAIFLVDQAMELCSLAYKYFTASDKSKALTQARKEHRTKTIVRLKRLFLTFVFSGVGHAIGTLIQPGKGTSIGGLLQHAPYVLIEP